MGLGASWVQVARRPDSSTRARALISISIVGSVERCLCVERLDGRTNGATGDGAAT